jgi:hypothetical protein
MTNDQVISQRTFLHSITHTVTLYDKDTNAVLLDTNGNPITKTVPSSISVMSNNLFGCNEQENEMWWDDTKGILYALSFNEMERISTTTAIGSKLLVPAKLTAISYGDIQTMTILVAEDSLANIFTAMQAIAGVVPAASVTAAIQTTTHDKYFKEYADMQYNIDKNKVNGYEVK